MFAFKFFKFYNSKNNQTGAVLTLVLVFGGIFLLLIGGLVGFISIQHKNQRQKVAWIQALQIAEAGIDYYHWHLNYDNDDFQDGTGQDGPYQHQYPQDGSLGVFELEIIPPQEGSYTTTIRSTGWTNEFPEVKRMIEVKYGRPSWAQYAYLSHRSVWFGDDEQIFGPIHSNTGIRFDGQGNSIISAAQETYICGPEHGCSSSGEEKPGVWGSGSPQEFFTYPKPSIDFWNIDSKLQEAENAAKTGGIYLNPSPRYGWHLSFKSDGTVDISEVRTVSCALGHDGESITFDCFKIIYEQSTQNYPLPANGVIFVKDDVWVDGIVNGKVTVIAAQLPYNASHAKTIILNNNLTYAQKDGNSILGLIAQKDILIPLNSPDNLEVNGILLAQHGSCYRHYYSSFFYSEAVRHQISLYGSIIHYRAHNPYWTFFWWPRASLTWSWIDNNNTVISGYENIQQSVDEYATYNPPPYFPVTGEHVILRWEEIE